MSKRFTRNIRSIKDIEKQPKETNEQNDLLSDENHVYVRNKDQYEQITGGVKEINGETPDENGNVNLQIKDLTGQEKFVRKNQLEEFNETITKQLAQIGVNVKTFGAIGDGVTDDTDAIKTGIIYAMENQLALFIPSGTFMIRPGVLDIDVYDNLYIYGVGEISQIKVFDELNNANRLRMFYLKIIEDVDKIEIKNLYINQNASGSVPPENAYDYQQSHTFRIKALENVTLKEMMFENVRINDPMGDGFNNSGKGTVGIYKVLNCKVTNRKRVRSDIQFSYMPSEVIINHFQGDVIESESLINRKSNIKIDNTTVNRVDGAPGQIATIYMNNTIVKEGAYFNKCKVIVSNSELTISPNNLRWNKMIFGSKITNSVIYLPYDQVENIINPLDIRCYGDMNYRQGITFESCDFLIKSEDSTITPSGFLVHDSSETKATSDLMSIKRFINCSFDTRASGNVQAYRSGLWYFDKCSFSGSDCSILLKTTSNYFVNVHINDGDYSNVTGYAFKFRNYDVYAEDSLINLQMTGYAKGENSTNYHVLRGSIDRLISERTLIKHSGTGGIKGDRKSSASVDYIGEVATVSSATDANWKNYGSIAP